VVCRLRNRSPSPSPPAKQAHQAEASFFLSSDVFAGGGLYVRFDAAGDPLYLSMVIQDQQHPNLYRLSINDGGTWSSGGFGAGTPPPASGTYALSVAPVPLPAALPLFATGLGLFALYGWQRRRQAKSAVA
jgi:hypothetical protein